MYIPCWLEARDVVLTNTGSQNTSAVTTYIFFPYMLFKEKKSKYKKEHINDNDGKSLNEEYFWKSAKKDIRKITPNELKTKH